MAAVAEEEKEANDLWIQRRRKPGGSEQLRQRPKAKSKSDMASLASDDSAAV